MRSIFLRNPETGKFYQRKIRKGVSYQVTEEELTFHVHRQAGFKVVAITECDPEPEEETLLIESVVPAPEEAPTKKRGPSVWDNIQEIDLEANEIVLEEFTEGDSEEAPTSKRGKGRSKKNNDEISE
jgi:hypothetical protein